ncbi:hypothetical protein GR183_18575 [Stappia sp. GBMRC 2046]|uniref:Uncharacterized protein n=1 Tax=Stappia sediminis TaxID=2692190 RepID=A0A7X3LXG2_9HYPH|nr:hypothetical protein [Stappia sediminis]MXN66924.1 hypothetical protein [Stappia sediminis]
MRTFAINVHLLEPEPAAAGCDDGIGISAPDVLLMRVAVGGDALEAASVSIA